MTTRIKQPDGTYCYSGVNCKRHGGPSAATSLDKVTANKDAFIKDARKDLEKKSYELARSAVPREKGADWEAYYAATDAKHFGDRTLPGSKFTDPKLKRFEDVVALASYQRGNLDGDDRDKFLAFGASPDAFKGGNRYLMVKTPGTVGVVNSAEMSDDTKVEVVRTKTGVPCSLVQEVDTQPEADYAVVVMVMDSDTGKPMAITGFPGVVTKSLNNEGIDALEGKTITLGEARKLAGNNLWLNTKLKSS